MAKPAKNEFAAWLARYRPDPVLFVREVLGADPDDWQVAVLGAYGRGERRISIVSCHRVGKTTVMSWMALHQILCFYPQKTVCTAPTSPQLFDALASEMKSWASRLPAALRGLLDVKAERIDLVADPDGSFISFRTSRAESPEALQGIQSNKVLLLIDEGSGVPEPVYESSAGSMAGENATTVIGSNPTRSSGFFYDTQHKLADMWFRVHVSADVPEASPTAYRSARVSQDFVEDIARRYDGRNSNAFRVRVLGLFPRSDLDTLIPLELVDAARQRDVRVVPGATVSWGLDVGGKTDTGDLSALAKRRANVLLEPVKVRQGLETMQVVGWVRQEYDATPVVERPTEILVDAIGIGAGVASRLMELGYPAQAINVAESPSMVTGCARLRDYLWRCAKEWFQARDCRFPDDEATAGELVRVKGDYNSNNELVVEPKAKMRKERRGSPDRADAFCLTFAGAAGVAATGWAPSGPWNQPLKRDLKGVY